MKTPFRRKILLAIIYLALACSFSYGSNSILSSGTWYKLSCRSTGIYILTYSDLANMGIPINTIDPRNISLYANGPGELPQANNAPRISDLQEIAIEITGQNDGVFNQGDTLFFYNHSQQTWSINNSTGSFIHSINHYSDSTSFFLTIHSFPGKRILNLPSLPTYTDSTSIFTNYYAHEIDSVNLISSGKEWYGEYFDLGNYQSRTFPLGLKNLVIGDSIFINTKFAGRSISSSTSTINYTINSTSETQNFGIVGTSQQDNYALEVSKNFYAIAQNNNDSVIISLQSSDPNTIGWLNYFETNANCYLIVDQSPLSFRYLKVSGPGRVVNFNVTSVNTIKIWNVSLFSSVSNQLFSRSNNLNKFNAAADSIHEYIAFDGINYLRPTYQGRISNQNLHSIGQKNMIIISDPDYINEAVTLAIFHSTHDNLSTAVVTSDQIYNEYSSGQQDPVAIRDFIRQIYFSSLTPTDSLKYVLLFGDGSYDFKNILGYGKTNIPIYQNDNSLGRIYSYCSDDFYSVMDSTEGNLNTNEIPDVAVGRIPVKNQNEALVVNKIIYYSSSSTFNEWRTKVVGVADDQTYNIWFKQEDTLMNRIENFDCGLNINKIYIDAFQQRYDSLTQQYSYPDANLAIQNSIRNGSAVIQYNGYGGELGWARERILERDFLDTVSNLQNLPLFISMTGSFNNFDNPTINSCGSVLVKNLNGGGIASISASRISFNSSVNNFAIKLDQQLFNHQSGNRKTLGEVFLQTKKGMHADSYTYSINLLGDPAVKLVLPENEVVTTFISSDTIVSWQPIQLTGEVRDVQGNLMTSFNGIVDITFFKPKTTHHTLNNDSLNLSDPSIPAPFFLWDDTLYSTSVQASAGIFSLNFIAPSGIDSGFGNGRIAYYAQDGQIDASGCSQQIIYKNLNPIVKENDEVNFKIFPNPTSDALKVVLTGSFSKDLKYSIIGIDGRIEKTEAIFSNEFTIERNNLVSGIYFLKIISTKSKEGKIMKIVFD